MAAPVYRGHTHIHLMVLHINSGHQMIASRSPVIKHLQVIHPWIIMDFQSVCLNVGVTIMEELD